MAIKVTGSNGQSIRDFLENLTEVDSITINGVTGPISDANAQLVWEGSQYYLVYQTTNSVTNEGTVTTTVTTNVRNLDDCLPMTITKVSTTSTSTE